MRSNREDGRLRLLAQLVDPEVMEEIRRRLTPEQIALLVVEAVNPNQPLSTIDQAVRDGVTTRTIRDRRKDK